MLMAKHIMQAAHLPQKFFETPDSFWKSHANKYISYCGSSLLIVTLNLISGTDAYIFRYLPLILIPFLLIVRLIFLIPVRKNNSSYIVSSILFVLYVIYIVANAAYQWRLTYQALGFISHIYILYILVKTIISARRFSIPDYLIMMLFFSISLLNYYTMSTISITFVLSLGLGFLLFERRYVSQIGILFGLGLSFFILYFNYDIMWTTILSSSQKNLLNVPSILIGSFSRYIFGNPPSEELFASGFPVIVSPEDRILSIIAHLFWGLAPIILVIIFSLIINVENKLRNSALSLILASLVTAGWESFPYVLAFGVFNLRYLIRFTPIVTLLILLIFSGNKRVRWQKVILYVFLLWFIIATVYQIKVPFLRDNVGGIASQKLELINYPEYQSLAYLSTSSYNLYSNFQVSGEIWLSSIKINKSWEVSISPFQNKVYLFLNCSDDLDLKMFKNKFEMPAILILTRTDFLKPVWGDFHGYAIKPIRQDVAFLFKKSFDIIYNSGRLIAYSIIS